MFFTNFEKLCSTKGKSPTAVGKELGIPKTTISYWRNTPGTTPKQDMLRKIATYFDVSTDYLLGVEKEKPPVDIDEERIDQLYKMTEDLSESEITALKAFIAGLKANRKPD